MRNWIIQAEADMKVAGDCVMAKNFFAAALFCQQVAEKSLKALYMESLRKEVPKTHNIVKLSLELGIPARLVDASRLLAPAYTLSRYPDAVKGIPVDFYVESNTSPLVVAAKEVLDWVKKKLPS